MVLDHVVALPAERGLVEEAMERSTRWAERCLKASQLADQAKFAIVQGGLDEELAQSECRRLNRMPLMDLPSAA
jgi:queuine tRNA-ribosyltransferase